MGATALSQLSMAAPAANAADEIRARLRQAVRDYVKTRRTPPRPPGLELCRSTLEEEELLAALHVLLDGDLTMGARTAAFEDEWSAWLPAGFSLMVNSGSSANLLMLSALTCPDAPRALHPGDEVIVPAVGWSTSLLPVAQTGCVPVLVDVHPDTLNLDPARVEEAITERTRAILAIHLLGNPCDLPRLAEIAGRHGLFLLEDCCEAHGAAIDGRRVGTFGALSSFSFYYSHHITSIEGGMICGQDAATWRDRLLSQRAHGWIRGRSDADRWARTYPDLDPRWLFVSSGYNVRPTEIQAAIGRVQLTKLPSFVEHRRALRRRWLARLEPYGRWLAFQRELPGHNHAGFGFSMIVRPQAPFTRKAFQAYLESRGIETRPIVGGNLARQPMMQHLPYRVAGALTHADLAHHQGVMIGLHADVTPDQEHYVVECIGEFLRSSTGQAA